MNDAVLTTSIFVILAILDAVCWLLPIRWKKRIEQRFQQNPTIVPPDSKKPLFFTDIPVYFAYFGPTRFGDYRHYTVNGEDTYVTYIFFCLFIPLFPVKCYRVAHGASGKYYFIGSDKMKLKEILITYFYDLAALIAIAEFFILLVLVIMLGSGEWHWNDPASYQLF